MSNQHQIQAHKIVCWVKKSRQALMHFSICPALALKLVSHNNFPTQGSWPPTFQCPNCGIVCVPGQRGKCIARGKTRYNLGLLNQFVKVCKKQIKRSNSSNQMTKPVNAVEKGTQRIVSVKNLHSSTGIYKSHYSSGEDNMVATINDDLEKNLSLNMPIKIKKTFQPLYSMIQE